MYCAKQRGRNNIQCYAEGMNSATQERVKLESDLHQALSLKQLELHYQPKVDTKTGLIHGVEALVRSEERRVGKEWSGGRATTVRISIRWCTSRITKPRAA